MRLHSKLNQISAGSVTKLVTRTAAVLLAGICMISAPAYAAGANVIIGVARAAADLHEKTNNLDEAPALNGGEIRFLENRGSDQQQLSAVIRSSDGKVIVVDGGQEADEEHLVSTIMEAGGAVDAWLVTHPQADHVGGLYAVLRDHRADIDIRGIYYNFFEYEWYAAVDPGESEMVAALMGQLSTVDPARLHSQMSAHDEVWLSENLGFRVLNSPVKTEGDFAVNSSGLMYDITVDGKHLIILGDMGKDVGDRLMYNGALYGIHADYVQMSHHGQDGVGESFYRALDPVSCIWPTTSWIYYVDNINTRFKTVLTKNWVVGLGVQNNYITIGDDVIIR